MASSFVRSMTVNLNDLMEAQFLMTYYAGVPPSEFNELPTYEFREMMRNLSKYKQAEADAKNPKKGNLNSI